MPKFNFGLDSSAAEAELGDGFYSGDCPPKGNYTVLVKQAHVKPNSNGDPRIALLLEITEEEGDKAQYNGYGFFTGLNVTDQGMPWVNNFLDAIGADRKKFVAGDVTVSAADSKGQQELLKIGTKKVVGNILRAVTKVRPYNGEDQLDLVRFLLDDDEGGGSRRAAEVEPDADAVGLGDSEDAAAADGADDASDGYTEEELEELSVADLKEVCDSWDLTYKSSAKKPELIKLILDAQNEPDETAGSDDSGSDAGDDLTEADMEDMSADDLKDYIKEKGWEMPKPPIKRKLVAAILQFQAEPPF